jgi:hypothetical protein
MRLFARPPSDELQTDVEAVTEEDVEYEIHALEGVRQSLSDTRKRLQYLVYILIYPP